jgi:nicotinamide-nucleotide amidase
VKQHVLNVPEPVLMGEGAVSEACAIELAENVRLLLKTEVGISFTGVAGPEPLEGKQPGTVFIGLAIAGFPSIAIKLKLGGNRQLVREQAVKYGFYHLYKKLTER